MSYPYIAYEYGYTYLGRWKSQIEIIPIKKGKKPTATGSIGWPDQRRYLVCLSAVGFDFSRGVPDLMEKKNNRDW